MKKIIIIAITILFFLSESVYQVIAADSSTTKQANPVVGSSHGSPPSPATTPSPATDQPTQATSSGSTTGSPDSSSQQQPIIAFPKSTSQSTDDSNANQSMTTDVNDPSPTPVLIPLHESSINQQPVYSTYIAPTHSQQGSNPQLLKTTGQIGKSLLLNQDDDSPNSLYNSESFSPPVTKFLLIFSFCLFCIGVTLVNLDKLAQLIDRTLYQRDDNSAIISGFDNI